MGQAINDFATTVGRMLSEGVRTVIDVIGAVVDAAWSAEPFTWVAVAAVLLLLWGVFRR